MADWYEYVINNASIPEWPYPVHYGKENVASCDVLVLGGGVAGCHAAINAANQGAKVIVVDKGPVKRSGCSGAGVDHWHAACTNPCCKISPEEMVEEHEYCGGYSYGELGNGISCYITCKEGWDALQDVEKMGVPVRDVNDEFAGAEFRDDETRLMFAYDYENRHIIRIAGGGNIKPAMYEEVKRQGVEIYDFVMATGLLTEGGKQGARVVGATGVNLRTGEFYIFRAKSTFLSMGSVNTLWAFSTELRGAFSEPTQTGDGSAMAWRAGAEFNMLEGGGQSSGGLGYIPHTVGNAHNTWFACNIVDANGKEVPWIDRDGKLLKTLFERYELAPGQKFFIHVRGSPYELREPMLIRDLPERIMKGEFELPLYADLPGMPEDERRAIYGLMVGNEGGTRYGVYDVYTKAGFDPDKDMPQSSILPPDMYTFMPWWRGIGVRQWRTGGGGGLVCDWDLKTNLEGLFTAGLQGPGGDHSAAACTGRYAGRKAAEYARTTNMPDINQNQVEVEKARVYAPVMRERGMGWKELKAGLCRIMQDYCGEYKSEKTLKLGLELFNSISESEAASVYARNPHELGRALECLNHITIGEMVMHASLARKASSKSLGFSRLDYPELDPPEWNKFVTIRLKNGGVQTDERPLRWWLQSPYASTYEENYWKHCGLQR
ncbi:MAG: FAD-dependent oxidoreductase [Dehalococcoidales bacterium]|nr:MAG: FAD-dependent oxidoreductase [Dehalococcoidales bacterium]